MTEEHCQRVMWEDLADYAAGELDDPAAADVEAHLYTCAACAARAADVEALVAGIRAAIPAGAVGGFVTDAVLNRLGRDGVRLRMFALAPGDVVPCAVWDADELLVLRLRADVAAADHVTLVHRIGGREVDRVTTVVGSRPGELLFATPAADVRQLPIVDIDIVLTVRETDAEREVGRYTLSHGGALHRRPGARGHP